MSSNYRVITSLRPNFEAILIDTGICLGETIELTNEITIDTLDIITHNGIFDTICLSDDYFQLWQSMCLNPIQTNSNMEITSADEIESICINMEHSYIGDLSIFLTCPNGQSVSLFEYPNGGGPAYFGIPIDDDTQPCVAGVGFDYCWSMDATANIVDFAQLQETIPAGSYIPVESFANLVGCPVSGEWCVSFQDNLYADDGIVFSISINFAEGFYSYDTITTIINTVDLSPDSEDIFWTGPGVGTNSGSTSVIPEIPGENTYTLSVTNNLGCTIDTSFNVTVYEINDPFCGTFCNSMVYENSTDTINDGSYEYPSQNNTSCDWLISLPSKTAEDLFFYWNYFDVYEGDILSIYAGNSDVSPLVLELSGNDEVPDWFIVPGNEAFISYKTNEFFRSPGWEMVYQTVLTGLYTNNNSGIVIYPNPADNYITVYGLDSASDLKIIDMSGRVIYSNPQFNDGNIDVSNLASGVYFVKIQKESHNETFKIIKK